MLKPAYRLTFRPIIHTLATQHAPAGGIRIKGKFFPGGEFIESGWVAKATPSQQALLEHRRDIFDPPDWQPPVRQRNIFDEAPEAATPAPIYEEPKPSPIGPSPADLKKKQLADELAASWKEHDMSPASNARWQAATDAIHEHVKDSAAQHAERWKNASRPKKLDHVNAFAAEHGIDAMAAQTILQNQASGKRFGPTGKQDLQVQPAEPVVKQDLTPEKPAEKEPWEMTRKQYWDHEEKQKFNDLQEALSSGKTLRWGTYYKYGDLSNPEHIRFANGSIEFRSGRKWFGTTPDMIRDLLKQAGKPLPPIGQAKVHQDHVEDALATGKPIPPEVLADYPDLKPADLPGGKADAIPPESFPPAKVAEGAKVEAEHTSDKPKAEEIARDHLAEDPEYYKKLKEQEEPKPEPMSIEDEAKAQGIVDIPGATPIKVALAGKDFWGHVKKFDGKNYYSFNAEHYRDKPGAANWHAFKQKALEFAMGNLTPVKPIVGPKEQSTPGWKAPELSEEQAARNIGMTVEEYRKAGGAKEQLTPAPSTPAGNPHIELAKELQHLLGTGDKIDAKEVWEAADKAHGGTRAQGKYQTSQAYDSLETAFNMHLRGKTDPSTDDLADAQQQAREIKDQISNLPTQTNRTGNKESFQQFSTPPHFSFAAAWAANIKPGEVVLEPSAGTGCLAVQAANAGANVYTNELDHDRAAFLKHQFGDDKVHIEDAEQISGILPKKGVPRPMVVVMNPPFSQTAGRMGDKKELLTGANHISEALRLLAPGGRLVAIVGEGMTPDKPTYRDWFRKISEQNELRANVGVSGDEYTKYGTSFGTRLLVIDKTGKPQQGETVVGDSKDVPDLLEKIKGVRDARTTTANPQGAGVLGGPSSQPLGAGASGDIGDGGRGWTGDDSAPAPIAPLADGPAGDDASGAIASGITTTGERQPLPGGEPSDSGSGGVGPRTSGEPEGSVADSVGAPELPAKADGKGKRGKKSSAGGEGGGKGARRKSPRQHLLPVPELRPASLVEVKALDATAEPPSKPKPDGSLEEAAREQAIFEAWRPRTMEIAGAKKHASPLVESAAMSAVRLPVPRTTLVLSPDLIEQKVVKDKLPDGRTVERELGLSEAGLEAAQYMAQAHEEWLAPGEDGIAYRRGMMSGDGTGTGKGRQVAAIIAHNLNQGRKKHVWVSLREGLINDARRDLMDMGIDGSKLFDFADLKGKSPPEDGIVFVTYATLRSGPKDKTKPQNLNMLTSWLGNDFEGVVAFDEAHAMANSAGAADGLEDEEGFSHSDASQQAVAGMQLQKALPKARVGYWTATGATEVDNLAYAERLGLWGRGTEFPNKVDFINNMTRGGVAAMEAVAQSLKATGGYNARTLSMNDGTKEGTVVTEKLEHHLEPHEIETYDAVAEGWQNVFREIDKILHTSGAKYNRAAKGAANSQFWGAQQRFFNQMLCSFQTRSVIEAMRKDIAEGRAPVVQLVNTMEASTNRKLRNMKEGETFDDIDVSPAEILVNYLEKSFPIHRYEKYKDHNGVTRSRLVRTIAVAGPNGIKEAGIGPGEPINPDDVESLKHRYPNDVIGGDPVEDPEAVAKRDELITGVANMRIPESPLDQFIREFGPNQISEVTGRKTRFVWVRDKHGNLVKERSDRNPDKDNQNEIRAFQNGDRVALVFSGAGNTGASYHSDKRAKNQKQRVHYVLQPGWSAAPLVQSLGRTHRTNQANAPIVRPVAIPLIPGNKRFLSSAARRLEQMGALTRGQKQAASGGLYGAEDNIESKEAQAGVDWFFADLKNSRIDGLKYEDVMHQLGFKTEEEDEKGDVRPKVHPEIGIRKFLNRLLATKVGIQNRIFQEFSDRHLAAIQRAENNGTLARGVEDFPHAEKIHADKKQVIHREPFTGAEASLITATVHTKTDKTHWSELQKRGNLLGFARNKISGKLWVVYDSGNRQGEDGQMIHMYRLLSPGSVNHVPAETVGMLHHSPSQIDAAKFKPVRSSEAEPEWNAHYDNLPDTQTNQEHFVTGALLPIWKRLGTDAVAPRIYRLKLDDGTKIVGRHIEPEYLDQFRHNFNIQSQAKSHDPREIHAQLEAGDVQARLSNGWRVVPVRFGHERRLEIKGWTSDKEMEPLVREFGLLKEKANYKLRYFIPTGNDGADILTKFVERRPITQVENMTTMSTMPVPRSHLRYRLVFSRR